MSTHKKQKNKVMTVILASSSLLLLLGLTGGIAYKSEGFKNWDVKNWFNNQANKNNSDGYKYIKLNLANSLSNSNLEPSNKLVTFLNNSIVNEEDEIFGEVIEGSIRELQCVYKDNGGLKIGNSQNNGFFGVTLKDYKFDRIKITGRNYNSFNETTSTYTCDVGGVSVNGSENYMFTTNEGNGFESSPVESKIFSFESLQDTLRIKSIKRITLLSIEMWDSNFTE